MKAEHINCFITSFYEVLEQMTNIKITKGNPYILSNPIELNDLVVIIGITGNIKGQLILSLDEAESKKIASIMMMGLDVKDFNEISKSAIGEITNMIAGKTITKLSSLNIKCDITPPSILTGNNIQISTETNTHIMIPFITDIGNVILGATFKYQEVN